MFRSLAQKLWGKFEDKEEYSKFIRLACIFAFTIGVYWLINPLKDVVFLQIVGKGFLPYAKIVAICFLFPLLILYGKLVDYFPRDKAFYFLCTVYAIIGLLFAVLLQHSTIGLPNTIMSGDRFIGWLWYAYVESFGSLMVGLFWSFASDTTTPSSAKKGFSIIALGAQFGGLTGPLLIYPLVGYLGPAYIIVVAACGMIGIAGMIYYFMHVTPSHLLVGFNTKDEQIRKQKKVSPGFFEGLRLIFSEPYLIGIVVIVAFYEIVATIIEFHMKIMAAETYTNLIGITEFFFKYAMLANGIALVSLLLGAGSIGRSLGLSKTLQLLPILMGIGVLCIWGLPYLPVALSVLVIIKGLNYALNQPAKEQLYIPTSRDSRYKAKAWIDIFGSRLSKNVGSSVHMLRPVLESLFMVTSSMICFSLIGVWIAAALFVTKEHEKAVEEDRQIC